ncbi:MAG TPA: hypothetical protein VFY10_11595 [Dehalococcoidia bacterium]|nr:hypothetical protein [Dehalococcoidia bacterium]
MTTTAANPPQQATEKTPTEYIVLEWNSASKSWKDRGTVAAASARAALRKHMAAKATANDQAGLELVAIPTRSWQPVKVTVETTTTVKLT